MSENNTEKVFVVAFQNGVQNEDDIFIIKADSIDNVLDIYAKQHHNADGYLKEVLEDRAINSIFWEKFFLNIFRYENGNYIADLSDDEIEEKFIENVEKYLGEDKHLLQELIDFYFDRNKTFEDLSEELRECIAVKDVKEVTKYIIIKEVVI